MCMCMHTHLHVLLFLCRSQKTTLARQTQVIRQACMATALNHWTIPAALEKLFNTNYTLNPMIRTAKLFKSVEVLRNQKHGEWFLTGSKWTCVKCLMLPSPLTECERPMLGTIVFFISYTTSSMRLSHKPAELFTQCCGFGEIMHC